MLRRGGAGQGAFVFGSEGTEGVPSAAAVSRLPFRSAGRVGLLRGMERGGGSGSCRTTTAHTDRTGRRG